MIEARLVAVGGSACAALLSTWFGNQIYLFLGAHTTYFSNPFHFSDPSAIWIMWGIPAAVAAVVATLRLTRRRDWLPRRWGLASLFGFASRCAGLACLLYVPIQIVCLPLSATIGLAEGAGTGGLGIVGSVLLMIFMDAFAIAFGILPAIGLQTLVLLAAKFMASSVELPGGVVEAQRSEP